MSAIIDWVKNYPIRDFGEGHIVLEQGQQSRVMLVFISGKVEIIRDGVSVATAAQPGVVFGEMSTLLGGPHTATVRAVEPCQCAEIAELRAFLQDCPEASLFVAELLARRLNAVTQYLIDLKRQYEGHDHMGMVDDVLETLIHLPPRARR